MASTLAKQIKKKIPGTSEYKKIKKSEEFGQMVLDRWADGQSVYSRIVNRVDKNRNFYLGKLQQQFNEDTTEGTLRVPVNIGASVLDLVSFLLSNNPPKIQLLPESASKIDQVESAAGEDLLDRALEDASFALKFKETAKHLVHFSGFSWWYPFWNTETKFGKKVNKFDFTLLNPSRTRVFYTAMDSENVDCFITTKRLTPQQVYKQYDRFEAVVDEEDPWVVETIQGEGTDQGKVTVYNYYDNKNMTVVINRRVAQAPIPHGFDYTPLIQINNISVINDHHGHDDLERWKPIAQELNTLISAAGEVARDLGYPPILEVNKALGGRKIAKWRGQKINVRESGKGEAVRYLQNPADLNAMLAQIDALLNLLHFVSLMPKAAAGVFDSSVTSGFQARLAMQPATLSTDNKKIDIEAGVKKLARACFWLIKEKNPDALKLKLPDGRDARLEDLHNARLEVIWPDNLPIDIAREVQNLVLGIQNSLTSVTQAVDKYNALMNLGSPEDTKEYLRQEAKDEELAPDRALKVAQVKQALAQIGEAAQGIAQKAKGGQPGALGQARESANPVNLLRAAAGRLPEEQRATPETAQEAVTPESTGGPLPEGT